MRFALALATLACACGSFGTTAQDTPPSGDAGVDGAVTADGGSPPSNACRGRPFTLTPTLLQLPQGLPATPGITAWRKVSATEAYGSTVDDALFTYTIDANDAPTGPRTNLLIDSTSFNKPYHPQVFDDGMGLVFQALPTTGGNERLFFAKRSRGSSTWESVTNVDRVPNVVEAEPYIVANKKIYFVIVQNGKDDIVTIERGVGDGWDKDPKSVTEINSLSDDAYPVVTEDDLEIFFLSRRGTSAQADVWTSTRTSTSQPFSTPVRVDALSEADTDDRPTFISRDGCTLYLTRKKGDPHTLWRATR